LKSSAGEYYLGLDHVRAFAAFMVFAWHFSHVNNNHLGEPSIIPLSLFSEGHTGVGLFMTLSGYIFAKILNGRKINYFAFLWNRALRLLPLLVLVIAIVGVRDFVNGGDSYQYLKKIMLGFFRPGLPNGGWSITVEFHFYLILPLLLYISSINKIFLPFFVLIAIAFRYLIFNMEGEVQGFSYWTIVGRIDQFILGILAYQNLKLFKNNHFIATLVILLFVIFYWYFESLGGFYEFPSYPSPSPLWIVMTTIEGLTYGALIAWYDNSFKHSKAQLSRMLALVGKYSYSIYLLHFFFYSYLAIAIDKWIIDLSNIYVALLLSVPAFLVMVPLGYLSFRFVESPFLRFRTSYFIKNS
jgi:peptidoglycan/LPS O-acetylase OafA/YrhL